MAGVLSDPPKKGDIYWVDFDRDINAGSEQNGRRPTVVISSNELNRGMKVVTVAAITSSIKPFGSEVSLFLPEGEPLSKPSTILAFQVRTIDQVRLIRREGKLSAEQLEELNKILRRTWDL